MKKMVQNSFLEDYYSGDRVWENYVDLCEEEFPHFQQEQMPLIQLLNNCSDIAIVVYQKRGNNSLAWVQHKIPALNGLAPVECLDEVHLKKRLKECLLRMP